MIYRNYMTEEQEARLPLYAKAELEELRNVLNELMGALRVTVEDPDVTAITRNYAGAPDRAAAHAGEAVGFYLNPAARAKGGTVWVRHLQADPTLEIRGSDVLQITPGVGNVIYVTLTPPRPDGYGGEGALLRKPLPGPIPGYTSLHPEKSDPEKDPSDE